MNHSLPRCCSWLWLAPSVALSACIPDLHTPPNATEGDEAQLGSDWEPPPNSWDSLDGPPADLVPEGYGRGQVFPDLRVRDQHGDDVSLWQFYGMVIALDISTMWCGPCQQLAVEVDHTWKDYRDEGFIYITMLPEDQLGQVPDQADLNVWADNFNITAPVVADDQGYAYEIAPDQAWPRILVIGRDMKVVEDRVSPAEDATIRATIEAAL